MGFFDAQVGRLKQALPVGFKNDLARMRVRFRMPSYVLRPLPGLLIIGAQKGGTSSLYKYLGTHPQVRPSLRKEVEYFSKYYERGEAWYRANFALGSSGTGSTVHFEASPEYLSDPRAPTRAHSDLPDAKIVALVRDPVERALSHYKHSVRHGLEDCSLQRALELEETRTQNDWARVESGFEGELPVSIRRFAYAAKGDYARGLERWIAEYGAEEVLILDSAEFFENTSMVLNRICSFIGVEPLFEQQSFNVFTNRSRIAPIPTSEEAWARQFLQARFEEADRRLAKLATTRLSWMEN